MCYRAPHFLVWQQQALIEHSPITADNPELECFLPLHNSSIYIRCYSTGLRSARLDTQYSKYFGAAIETLHLYICACLFCMVRPVCVQAKVHVWLFRTSRRSFPVHTPFTRPSVVDLYPEESSTESAANIYDWLKGSLVSQMFHIHPTVSIELWGNPCCCCCCDDLSSRSVNLHIVYFGPDEAAWPCAAKSHTPPGLWVKRWRLHVWCTVSNAM